MTPDTLRIVGETLHGRLWQAALARDLRRAVITVQRWTNGLNEPPPSLKRELEELCRQRKRDLDEALKLLSLTQ